jgi:hypothetical protein
MAVPGYVQGTRADIQNIQALGQARILIAVEDENPQVFVEKRDNWVKELLKCRDSYEKTYLV